MSTTASALEVQTFTITEDIDVHASIEKTFKSLVAQIGRLNETPDGTPLPMVLELRPGGRWYRDLGGENGHLWGFIQSIKRPTLLEICGPMFMSYAALSHLQLRLTPKGNKTLLVFRHQALGLIEESHRKGIDEGWGHFTKGIKEHAERNNK